MITAAKEALSFDEALLVARERARNLRAELVPIAHAAGRRLAEDVPARVDFPGFTGSAMDGYAVRAQDLPGTLRIVGESAAGSASGGRLGRGEAVRISTGAALPDGADAVVRREDAREQDGAVRVLGSVALDDLETAAILVTDREHRWHARPAEQLPDADAAGV